MTAPNLLDELEGVVRVPIRPTPEMLDRAVYAQEPNMGVNRGGSNNVNRLRRRAQRIYAAMLQGAIREQEVAIPSSGAAQGEAVELEAGTETKSTEGRSRAELIAALAQHSGREG